MISLTKHRSRRLRKRLRVGEFQELGFKVSFELPPELGEHQMIDFWDAFILEAIERNGLAYGGGTSGFATSWGRGSATEAHRETVRSWLSSRAEVQSVDVGPLVDSWHGGKDENAL
jgi:uncharacterized protein YggL (DUF469 family)